MVLGEIMALIRMAWGWILMVQALLWRKLGGTTLLVWG